MLLIIALALALRLPGLERRPMHNDEAVQAAKTGILFETGKYEYDPNEFHGPTLYYFTLPSLWISSVKSYAESNEFHYRIVPVAFSVGLILLLLLVTDGMGRTAILCSGTLTAVSPAMVFYSGYYIQEMPLVFFSFAAIAFGWRYVKSGALIWVLLAGASSGLMHATKETCAIAFASMAVALGTHCILSRTSLIESKKRLVGPVFLAMIFAALISVLFYSSFFSRARGPIDSILAFERYFTRSTGPNIHDKPWRYYIRLLTWNNSPGAPIWTEAFIVALAVRGGMQAFRRAEAECDCTAFARFMAIYTITMIVVYSLIGYKTPWCALGFLHGLIVLAGIGATHIFQSVRHWILKTLAIVAFGAGATHLGWQSYLATGRFMSDTRNPYAYAFTVPDTIRLCKRIEDFAAVHPDGAKMPVIVMAANADYWPLPWYLRKLERVGYSSAPPGSLNAPVLVSSSEFDNELALELRGKYEKNQYGLRPGVLLWLHVEKELWKNYLNSQSARKSK